MYRTGIGYDCHRLVRGRALVLGGVEIPFAFGLEGHSDADVILHAICDAVLGSLGLGDIGEHFPNTDAKYKNISSLKLLETVSSLASKADFVIVNVDVVLLAQEPKIKVYKLRMKAAISRVLKVDESSVNIKATTTEGAGAIGRQEAMAAYATVLLRKRARRKK